MKRKLIIHIGLGKTGSSSIQKTLRLSKSLLEKSGVAYLGLMLEQYPFKKAYSWQKASNWPEFLKNEEKVTREMLLVIEKIDKSLPDSTQTLIWSNESFFENVKYLQPLLTKLDAIFDLELVGYIRRPDSWIVSAYVQWGIKHKSYSGPLKRFQAWARNKPYHTGATLQEWQSQVVIPRFYNFDEAGDVTLHFIRNFLPQTVHGIDSVRANDSPSAQELAMFAYHNGFFKGEVRPEEIQPLLVRAHLSDLKPHMPAVNNLMPTEEMVGKYIEDNKLEIEKVNSYFKENGESAFDLTNLKFKDYSVNQQQLNQAFVMMIKSLNDQVQELKKRIETTMIEECIVHVGMHKTGSSSIQQSLQGLKTSEFEYLELGDPNHSGVLTNLYARDPTQYHSNIQAGRDRKKVRERQESMKRILGNALNSSQAKFVIISAEALSGFHIDSSGLNLFKELLLEFCKRIRLIGYVRSPVSYIQSAFGQQLKRGINPPRLDCLKIWPNYQKRFARLDQIFGQDSVHLIPFNKKFLLSVDVVLDFSRRIGLEIQDVEPKRINESLSLETVSLLYVYRHFIGNTQHGYSGKPGDDQKLVEVLSTIGSNKLRFGEKILLPILENNKKDLDWISQRLGVDITDQPDRSDGLINCENDLFQVAQRSENSLRDVFVNNVDESRLDSCFIAELEMLFLSQGKYKVDFSVSIDEKLLDKEVMDQLIQADQPKAALDVLTTVLQDRR